MNDAEFADFTTDQLFDLHDKIAELLGKRMSQRSQQLDELLSQLSLDQPSPYDPRRKRKLGATSSPKPNLAAVRLRRRASEKAAD